MVASPKILRVFIRKLALLVTWEEVSFLGALVSCPVLKEWLSGQPCSLFFALLGPAGKHRPPLLERTVSSYGKGWGSRESED